MRLTPETSPLKASRLFNSTRQFNSKFQGNQSFFARVRTLAVEGDAAESVTCTVTLKSPVEEGMPLRTPALERVIPAGICPAAIFQAYGGVPPCAARVAEYSTAFTAVGSVVVVTDRVVEVWAFAAADCELLEPIEQPQQVIRSASGRIICFTHSPRFCTTSITVLPNGSVSMN
jgi:hypothetical protein